MMITLCFVTMWVLFEIKVLRDKLSSMYSGDLNVAINIDLSDLFLNFKIHDSSSYRIQAMNFSFFEKRQNLASCECN